MSPSIALLLLGAIGLLIAPLSSAAYVNTASRSSNGFERGYGNGNEWQNNGNQPCHCGGEGDAIQKPSTSSPGSLTPEKQELLDVHNMYRRQVAQGKVKGQPGTSKLKDLKWSAELERSAQGHADKCRFVHDAYTDRATSQWAWVGQNIAYSSGIKENMKLMFDENEKYNYNSNSCSAICLHYTQIVWADTTHVGCGVKKCKFNGYNSVYVVCNYGPTGNFNGKRPY